MSLECSECERDIRSGHDPSCSRYRDVELARLRAEVERLTRDLEVASAMRTEAIKREMTQWLKSPAFETFAGLKHGPAGDVLFALQEGEISRGRAAECLAEILHGATEVRLPEYRGIFGEDETPADVVTNLRSELTQAEAQLAAAREDTARINDLERWLTEDPTRWEIVIRRLETTGQFLVALKDAPRSTFKSGGADLRAALDAARKETKNG